MIVDDQIVFRLPRTEMYARRVAVDVRLLRALRDVLPVPIPDPEFVSLAPLVMGYRKLPGQPVLESDLLDSPSECTRLGQFLDRLHGTPIDDVVQSGLVAVTPNKWRGGWARAWRRYRTALVLLPPSVHRTAEQRWKTFLDDDTNFDFEPAVVHADLRPAHVLWDNGRIAGVIDWSDAQVGDVAMDFAWPLSLPSGAASSILDSYSARSTRGLFGRARFYEWTGWWSEAIHGIETGDSSYVDRGVAGIMRQID